jgi:hypothetical protein
MGEKSGGRDLSGGATPIASPPGAAAFQVGPFVCVSARLSPAHIADPLPAGVCELMPTKDNSVAPF